MYEREEPRPSDPALNCRVPAPPRGLGTLTGRAGPWRGCHVLEEAGAFAFALAVLLDSPVHGLGLMPQRRQELHVAVFQARIDLAQQPRVRLWPAAAPNRRYGEYLEAFQSAMLRYGAMRPPLRTAWARWPTSL